MTAPTSPKPHTPADPNDLRTALTKLAVKYENLGNDEVSADAVWCDLMNLPWPAAPAPVSDTRREDVEALRGRHGAMTWEEDNYAAGWEHALDAVLAVLPAPPVVDEAEALIEAHIAEFEASIARLEASIQDPNNTVGGREYDTAKLHGQRGAVYALRRLASDIARGATR